MFSLKKIAREGLTPCPLEDVAVISNVQISSSTLELISEIFQ